MVAYTYILQLETCEVIFEVCKQYDKIIFYINGWTGESRVKVKSGTHTRPNKFKMFLYVRSHQKSIHTYCLGPLFPETESVLTVLVSGYM